MDRRVLGGVSDRIECIGELGAKIIDQRLRVARRAWLGLILLLFEMKLELQTERFAKRKR